MSKFADLGLRAPILRAVEENGYETMTPIQSQAIPQVLEGKDLIGIAQTGTGKTASFSLPLLQLLLGGEGKRVPQTTRALVLAPTRELAVQIGENIKSYSKYLHLKTVLVYGGASINPQIKAVKPGVDILVATPGRLLDLMNQGEISLSEVEYLVLDEADRMLDMGFIRDIERIVEKLPKERQTLFFSATMPGSVAKLANSLLKNPVRIDVAPAATTAERIDQHVLMVPKNRKRELLAHVLKDKDIERVLVFSRTKHGANRISRFLEQRNISSSAIHGDKSQNARQNALNEFKEGKIRALVATDVAARGIDVEGVTHVINYDLPTEPENYVHRIGRTARAGTTGVSLSFCDHDERKALREIEKTIRKEIPMKEDHPFHMEGIELSFVGAGRERSKEAETDTTTPKYRAPKRRSNSGKHKPNRRLNQPKAHGARSGGSNQTKGRPAKKRSRPKK